jgi:hypothetical protein
MIQPGQGTNFADETGGQIGLGCQVGEQNLHGLGAVGNNVTHAIHAAHATNAKEAYNLVVGDLLTNLKPHKLPPGSIFRDHRKRGLRPKKPTT